MKLWVIDVEERDYARSLFMLFSIYVAFINYGGSNKKLYRINKLMNHMSEIIHACVSFDAKAVTMIGFLLLTTNDCLIRAYLA